jgi:hypothetical protein
LSGKWECGFEVLSTSASNTHQSRSNFKKILKAHAVDAGSAGISDVARLEIHTQAALQNTSFNDT